VTVRLGEFELGVRKLALLLRMSRSS